MHARLTLRCPFKPTYSRMRSGLRQRHRELIKTTTNVRLPLSCRTILGVGGFIVPPPATLNVRSSCTQSRRSFLLTRYKRLGTDGRQMVWDRTLERRARHHCFGEGLGNGVPLGITVPHRKWRINIRVYISTFGGNPFDDRSPRRNPRDRRGGSRRNAAEVGGIYGSDWKN